MARTRGLAPLLLAAAALVALSLALPLAHASSVGALEPMGQAGAASQDSHLLHLDVDDESGVWLEVDEDFNGNSALDPNAAARFEDAAVQVDADTMFASWSEMESPPQSLLSTEQSVQLAAMDPHSADAPSQEEAAALSHSDASPPAELVDFEAFTARLDGDHALVESSTSADPNNGDAPLTPPKPDFNGQVRYTCEFEVLIPKIRNHWANILLRGENDSDRTPGIWSYPDGSRIHWRHTSTRTWNDGVDSATSVELNKWTRVKAVFDHNRAWIFVGDMAKVDSYIELGDAHHFTWGKKSLKIGRGSQIGAGYANEMRVRNFQWKNSAEPLPAYIPRPNFDAPVKYTVEFDLFVDKPHSTWRNILNRGLDNSDRTPGIWTHPNSARIHWRHATNKQWNTDLDISWTPPYGKWYSFKGVVNHDHAFSYVNGMLDRVIDLRGTGEHFIWGKKSLGFATGPQVHPSYGPAQIRNFKWTNDAAPFPAPSPNFDKDPQFTVSWDMKVPAAAAKQSHWPSLFSRGFDNGDRSPAAFYMPGRGVHIRFGSTQTWNHDLDTTTPVPLDRFFNVKLVMDKTRAWVYQDGRFERLIELPAGQKFIWTKKSRSFCRGLTTAASHHNDGATRIQTRNFQWSNEVESLPLALPQPQFDKPVDYTLQLEFNVPANKPNWAALMNRGMNNEDRSPGIWTYPGSTRIHVRHASTQNSNDGCDGTSTPALGQWHKLKVVVKNNNAKTYINDKLEGDCTLPAGHHFTWGKKSLGWAHGGGVHSSYHEVQTRNLRFSPQVARGAFQKATPATRFWSPPQRPGDQKAPKPLPKFRVPDGVKPAEMEVNKGREIPVQKRISPSKLPVAGKNEVPKPAVPAAKPAFKRKVLPKPKAEIIDPMTGKGVKGEKTRVKGGKKPAKGKKGKKGAKKGKKGGKKGVKKKGKGKKSKKGSSKFAAPGEDCDDSANIAAEKAAAAARKAAADAKAKREKEEEEADKKRKEKEAKEEAERKAQLEAQQKKEEEERKARRAAEDAEDARRRADQRRLEELQHQRRLRLERMLAEEAKEDALRAAKRAAKLKATQQKAPKPRRSKGASKLAKKTQPLGKVSDPNSGYYSTPADKPSWNREQRADSGHPEFLTGAGPRGAAKDAVANAPAAGAAVGGSNAAAAPAAGGAGTAGANDWLNTLGELGLANKPDGGVGEARFENGQWIGKHHPKHASAPNGKLCPDCTPIEYNADSPLSAFDVQQLRAQHEKLIVDDVPLLAQDDLNRAILQVDDADRQKAKLLQTYPVNPKDVTYEEGDAAE